MPKRIETEKNIRVGNFSEDCAFHPCLCIAVGEEGDPESVAGVSLVDGSGPRFCSARRCGLRLLTVQEAIHWKFHGLADEHLDPKDRWWKKP